VGADASALDAPTSAWFGAFCTGFTPVLTLTSSEESISAQASDPVKGQQALVDFYRVAGTASSTTATALAGLAPPSFTGGPAYAAKVQAALAATGSSFVVLAVKLAAVDVSKNPQDLKTALAGVGPSMTTALAPLTDLASFQLNAATLRGLAKLPACAKIAATG